MFHILFLYGDTKMNYEEAFNKINQTNYEREKGINIISREVVVDGEDIKLIKVGKSDNQFGYCILYKTSINKDFWSWWYPSGKQQKLLPKISEIIQNADKHNSQHWGKK